MYKFRTIVTVATAFLALAVMTGLVGCSGADSAINPSNLQTSSSPPKSPSGEGVALGYFQFVWDDDGTVRVEETQPIRGAELNVTKYASIVIENFFFNEKERNWYITATIKNISKYTGYDVLAVFHSLGNKFVTNQDGFMWVLPPIFPEPTRCPFIAYGKNQPNRIFPPMFQDTRTIIMHQPEGVPKLAPLGFWIEAWAKNRTFPGVEDLKVELLPIDIYPPKYRVTGFIWDHQSPSNKLTVWADCTKFNGQNYVQMFDDGQHGDGAANDKIWGGEFSGDPEKGYYVITVYAFDPQDNKGENDVGFWHGPEAPCDLPFEYFPFQTIDKGEQSGINYQSLVVIDDEITWQKIWKEHKGIYSPMPPAPLINFEKFTVIGVWTGDRPSNNHIATIKEIYLDPCEELVTVLYEYTPYIPCGPLTVITDPYHIVILPKISWPVYFSGKEVDCPPPPPECVENIPFATVIQGPHSGIHTPYETVVKEKAQFIDLWAQHTSSMFPPPPLPEVDFTKKQVIAVGLGDRPTGGFECVIVKICRLTDQSIGVFYKERIPGKTCTTPDVITQPHHWVVMKKDLAPVKFFKEIEVYECGDNDCQQPLPFFTIDAGEMTGHKAGEFVFKTQETWHAFWKIHKPDTPPPTIEWTKCMVLAMLIGERPSSGFYVKTDKVCLNKGDDGKLRMDVKYTEYVPGENCPVLAVITKPYEIIAVPKFDGPVYFYKSVKVYDCPPECKPVLHKLIEEGAQSCAEKGNYGFAGFSDESFKKLWWKVHCWDNGGYMPSVPPADPGTEWVPFLVQLGEKPSTGYYVTIDEVCIKGCEVYVKYTEWIPGKTCNVLWIITKPWNFSMAQLPVIDCMYKWYFEGKEKVYECNEPCQDVPFKEIANGIKSCADAGEYGFQYEEDYKKFWAAVNCLKPGDPAIPPLPEDPKPIQGGIIYHFGIQLDKRPTTGYYLTIDKVCIEGCNVYIDYTEMIPGPGCNVLQIITKPWIIGAVELPPVYCYWTWKFNKKEVVYECK